jgi:predicted DNA-binding transcriptional regulator YafY
MSINKNAFVRYRILDKCFRNPGKRYFIEDLIEECSNALFQLSDLSNGVSRRQVLYDISFMESEQGWNATIQRLKDGTRVYFKYEDTTFSINKQPFNEMEENQIKEALDTLSRFTGLPQFEWVSEITARIDSGFNLSKNNKIIIEFDQNKYLKGLHLITPLYNAIKYMRVINLKYKSFKVDKEQVFIIHPYFLKQFNNRWYIFGINNETKKIINLALDRIIDIKEIKKKYIENTEIDFNEYFEDIIGVSLDNNNNIEKVLISVSNSLMPYIETKPIHGSQKLVERKDDNTLISIEVVPNYELDSLLLSFGQNIKVLKPVDLRNRIADKIDKMYMNYK